MTTRTDSFEPDDTSTIRTALKEIVNSVGRECVGCGYCCLKRPCHMSPANIFGWKRCPVLQWDGERYRCGLMEIPDPVGAYFRQEIYTGAGCCSPMFNDWRKPPIKRREELEFSNETAIRRRFVAIENKLRGSCRLAKRKELIHERRHLIFNLFALACNPPMFYRIVRFG